MAELEPTVALIAFLRDVRDRKVITNEHDGQIYLELPGDPPAQVSDMACALEDAGWIREPADSVVWELTGRGGEVLDRGAP
jgi:hypothetical protein